MDELRNWKSKTSDTTVSEVAQPLEWVKVVIQSATKADQLAVDQECTTHIQRGQPAPQGSAEELQRESLIESNATVD